MLQWDIQAHSRGIQRVMKPSIAASIFLGLFFLAGCSGISGKAATPTRVPTIQLQQAPIQPSLTPERATPTAAAGASAVWAVNPADRLVLRIDPRSNSIVATIPIEGEPSLVVAGEGSVWVLDRKYELVFRIDPETNLVTASIPLPSGDAETLTTGAGSVWVGMTGRIDLTDQQPGEEGEVTAPGMVVQIDAQSNEIVKQLSVQPATQIVVEGTNLWVLSRGTIDTPLQLFDLTTQEGMAVPLQNGPEWLPAEAIAVSPDSLWLFSASYAKIFRATTDGIILSAVPFKEAKPTGYTSLLLNGSELWAATAWGSLLHINAVTNHVLGQVDLGIPLSGLAEGGGSIWAESQQTGAVYRIDAERNEVVAKIPTGKAVQPTVIPTPTTRIVIWKPCPDAATSRLKVGDIAYVTKDPPLPNRIRKEPSRQADILGVINPGGSMDIIDGPACADGWVWWKVKNADYEGWTSEGDQETYWLIPLYR